MKISRLFAVVCFIAILGSVLVSTSTVGRRKSNPHNRGAKALDYIKSKGRQNSVIVSKGHHNHGSKGNKVLGKLEHISAKNASRHQSSENRYTGYKCPMGANSIGDGLAIIHADPYDCNKYYYCVWGIAKVSTCNSFLLWNDVDKVCDWYWNVNCENRGRRSLFSFF